MEKTCPCSPESEVSQAVAEVFPPLPSSFPPTLCSSGFAEALPRKWLCRGRVTKGDNFLISFFLLKAIGLASETANAVDGDRRDDWVVSL